MLTRVLVIAAVMFGVLVSGQVSPPGVIKPCQCSGNNVMVGGSVVPECTEPDPRFGGEVSCYVVRPHGCNDAVPSGLPDTDVSANACD